MIYLLLKNADFVEGRGPMLFERAFTSLKALKAYVNTLQSGVYGWKPPDGKTFFACLLEVKEARASGKHNPFGGWEGYEIREQKDGA